MMSLTGSKIKELKLHVNPTHEEEIISMEKRSSGLDGVFPCLQQVWYFFLINEGSLKMKTLVCACRCFQLWQRQIPSSTLSSTRLEMSSTEAACGISSPDRRLLIRLRRSQNERKHPGKYSEALISSYDRLFIHN